MALSIRMNTIVSLEIPAGTLKVGTKIRFKVAGRMPATANLLGCQCFRYRYDRQHFPSCLLHPSRRDNG